MDERNFRIWLEQQKNYHTARTYASRCMRVESEMNINLDEEYFLDGGAGLLEKMKYTRDEQRQRKKPMCGLKFEENVDVYTGMNSLRASIKKYFEFMHQSKEKE